MATDDPDDECEQCGAACRPAELDCGLCPECVAEDHCSRCGGVIHDHEDDGTGLCWRCDDGDGK